MLQFVAEGFVDAKVFQVWISLGMERRDVNELPNAAAKRLGEDFPVELVIHIIERLFVACGWGYAFAKGGNYDIRFTENRAQ